MGIIQTIVAFLLCLGILVSIHEWGHFWVARRVGVKVLRFSIGFGKALFTWKDRYGTEFTLSMIPLGGYVKMLDEREGDVHPDETDKAFNRKNVWARIAVVIAGPLANFLLAMVALWIMYLVGIKTIIPTIGTVIPDSPAAQAGLGKNSRFTAIDGRKVYSWNDVNLSLASLIGERGPISMTTQSEQRVTTHKVNIEKWPDNLEKHGLLDILGVQPWAPAIPPIIGKTIQNLPASRAGILPGDRIIRINNEVISNWQDMVDIIRKNPETPLNFSIMRDNQNVTLELTPETQPDEKGKKTGFIGAEAAPVTWPQNQIRHISHGPLAAFGIAAEETWQLSKLTVQSLYKMVTGILSLDNLSGPVTIARVASASLHSGLESFLYFIAMLSISLGVINLLPVPALDGGHLLYYIVEVIRGRPLSQKIQNFGLRIGIMVVLCIMLIALYNDFTRL